MLAVGLCYAELSSALPVSGGEVAYAYEIFGLRASFVTGWFLVLVWLSAASFEALSAGWIATVLAKGDSRQGTSPSEGLLGCSHLQVSNIEKLGF